ncbi:MAG: hypothetical protein GWN99_15295 [Gemmatimonadetes bacterium]|uniref:Uncharacterized protein n=1 Tax=Candidatus Kutchimonas denitrificans TaxID=3056748 RepID=A0AAE4ZBG1_9BACT|nr:hypothetical protein [Gemmatimonadota bacterium]NIR76663.1 hypothetical protein [Candidatus Kutchimonas denitrificans]NIS02412.1 hypothetical protein [Gemmatimonadota bacterium]NIT68316.1 hypothetical protein [Gemmatimonadota bacterium]NIU54783.1 hypothetical protein [Gemmatimonadota bacterium]
MFDDMKEYERLATVMKKALESGEDEGEVTDNGSTLRFKKNPAPGIRLRIEPKPGDEGARRFEGTVYDAAPDRPEGYPDQLPFLPDQACMVMTVPGTSGASVQWQVDDAQATAGELERLSEADGWQPSEQSVKAPSFLPIGLTLLQRGDDARLIIHTSVGSKSAVMLLDGVRR